jgi:hypothetical protein
MNCEECNGLITSFLDDELDDPQVEAVRTHLTACADCAAVFADFASILDICNRETPSELVPPNSQALWLRINNIIEGEKKAEAVSQRVQPRRLWRFSFLQVSVAVLCVAVVSSLLTVVVIRNYIRPAATDLTAATRTTAVDKLLGKLGLVETPQQARERRLKEQQAAIEYWNERVQARRVQWDRTTRDAFDRNLQVIDESVNDYTMILQQDPDDELSGEMLDSVLDDKMNLLRDFSDL